MTKKLSIVKFVFVSIAVVLGICLSIFSFPIPFTTSNFNGFINSIPLGLDIAGGYSAVYNIELEDDSKNISEEIDYSIDFIKSVLNNQGYSDAVVVKQGDSQIRLTVSKNNDPKTLISTLGSAGDIYIKSSETTDVSDSDIIGEDIERVYSTRLQTSETEFSWGVMIEFTQNSTTGKSGAEKYENLTSTVASSGNTIYIYMDDELYQSVGGITSAQTTGTLFLSGGGITSQETANQFALRVMVGTLETKLSQDPNSVIEIPSTITPNFLMFACVAISILSIVFVVLMVIKFRDFGWMSLLSLLVYAILVVFFMQAVPIVLLTLGGIIATAIGLALLFFTHILLFSNIANEYANGKKIHLSIKSGYKKSVLPIVDINVVAILLSFVMWFLGDLFSMSFGIILSISSLMGLFTTLLVTKAFMKWYLPINSSNAKKLGLKRGENVNEI